MRALALVLLVTACGAKEETEDYIRKSREITARTTLKGISRNAKQIVAETGLLPTGSIGPTPSQPCCASPDKKCPVDMAEWRAQIWDDLMVSADRASHFQYSYQSDGQSFTATATGDVLCDGKTSTFTITGKIGADKQLVVDESQVESSKKP